MIEIENIIDDFITEKKVRSNSLDEAIFNVFRSIVILNLRENALAMLQEAKKSFSGYYPDTIAFLESVKTNEEFVDHVQSTAKKLMEDIQREYVKEIIVFLSTEFQSMMESAIGPETDNKTKH